MADYLSVNDFKSLNPLLDVTAYSTATLSGFVTQASRQVDNFVNYSLDLEVITDEKTEGVVDNNRNLVIFPRKRPVISVESIDLVKGSDVITLDLQDGSTDRFDIPDSRNRILYPDGELSINSVAIINSFDDLRHTNFFVRLDYTAGYETIPKDIEDAVNLLTIERVARAQNSSGASSIRQGGLSVTYESKKGESDNVRDAYNLLRPYRRLV